MDADGFVQLRVIAPKELQLIYVIFGRMVREYFWSMYTGGEMDAACLATIADFNMELGGCGSDDFDVKLENATKHASEHITKVLAKEITVVDFDYVQNDLNDKLSGARVVRNIPSHEELADYHSTLPARSGCDTLGLLNLPKV